MIIIPLKTNFSTLKIPFHLEITLLKMVQLNYQELIKGVEGKEKKKMKEKRRRRWRKREEEDEGKEKKFEMKWNEEEVKLNFGDTILWKWMLKIWNI